MFTNADIIHTYTRAQALEDGVLIDVTDAAREAGFKHPVAITDNLYNILEPGPALREKHCQTLQGRLADVLNLLRFAIHTGAGTGTRINFQVLMQELNRTYTHDLLSICGPGDDSGPVITIMLPGDE